ncbi:unnamed protein product (macronuclear) [Paramecium tetraurelia]|uniref:F-box domain-containing protein n=1 Tax=Paramecium tetraurelia TaxID=5888 RepID=A0CBX4_PARTE|nr:uncharacterized protein GSPATT00037074001 [Paramecium tetraurelia]CAK68291.1 unnamed protein product [Paramecium tetraurelia]|eukprot:XP_001435688.1 hypothetical protein (macronuclear) [Paramecium tetraurelia strain d4-2]
MDKLDKIIAQLDELEISQKHREELLKRNQATFLLRLPKVILIQRVCGFLDDNDLYRFTATCSTLRKVMFCPLGFKLLMLSRNANHLVGGPKHSQIQLKHEKIDIISCGNLSTNSSMFDTEEDALAQLEVLKAVKDFLQSKLQDSQATIQKLQDMLEDAQATLKYEKSVNLRLQSKINILQNQLSISELQRQDVRENLAELNSKYNKIITQMEQDKIILLEDKEKLLKHKQVLIEEVYRLRGVVAKMEENQNNYKEALRQVKTFMESVEVKPV